MLSKSRLFLGVVSKLTVNPKLSIQSLLPPVESLAWNSVRKGIPQLCHTHCMISTNMSSKYSVYITRSDIPQEAIDILKQECHVEQWNQPSQVPSDELLKGIVGKDALFCLLTDQINEELIKKAGPKLKVVGTMSVGYDHVDVGLLRSKEIKLGYTPNILTDAVAELTMGLVLATSRRLFEAHKTVFEGGWGPWSPLWMCGKGLADSTVGLVGLGRIGQAVAERIKAFKPAKILYSGRSVKKDAPDWAQYVSLDDLLAESDFVVVTCALTPETRKMFNSQLFAKIKKGAAFINTSRGAVVDQDALLDALTSGHLSAAGLDVTDPEPLPTDHPLLALPNCVVLPHIGSATTATRVSMAVMTAHNILAGLKGEPMPAQVC